MEERVKRSVLWSNYFTFLLNGIAVLMLGAILPYLLREFHLSYSLGGLLLALQAIGNLGASILSGILSVLFGRKATLVLGAVFHIIGFSGIILVAAPFWLMVFTFIIGMGWGTLNNMSNLVVSDATGGKVSAMNLLHMFFALGAFMAPLLVGLFVKINLGWHVAAMVVIGLSVVMVMVFLVIPVSGKNNTSTKNKLSWQFLKQPRYFIFMGILLLYVGTESSINGWIVTYLINSGILNEITAQSNLSLLWVAIIFGRLLCANLAKTFSKEMIILGCSMGGLLFFTLFMLTRNPLLITLYMLGSGFFFSGIYPTTVANASYLIQGSGLASGLLFACGGLGASIIPYLTGVFADSHGLSTGVATIVCATVLLIIMVVVNILAGRKHQLALVK